MIGTLAIQRNQTGKGVVLDQIQFRLGRIDLGEFDFSFFVVAIGRKHRGEFEEIGFVGGGMG